ncbi:hypothetical protein PENTCL1PPCAC_9515, partial [Pristionchus entomophagus]
MVESILRTRTPIMERMRSATSRRRMWERRTKDTLFYRWGMKKRSSTRSPPKARSQSVSMPSITLDITEMESSMIQNAVPRIWTMQCWWLDTVLTPRMATIGSSRIAGALRSAKTASSEWQAIATITTASPPGLHIPSCS